MKRTPIRNHGAKRAGAWTAAFALTGWAVAASANTIVQIPTLGGSMVSATALNNVGAVAGFSTTTGNGAQHPFLWVNDTVLDLGTLGGNFGFAFGLNDINQVAGDSYLASGQLHAFRFSNGAMQDLGTLGGTMSTFADINDAGLVVGSSLVSGNLAQHAFLHDGQTMVDLGTLGGNNSAAAAVNASGQVAGDSYLPGNTVLHPFLYDQGSLIDLGTLGGNSAFATDINDSGVVVGESETANGEDHAFAYMGGAMIDLGTLGGTWSSPYVINNQGLIAGDSSTPNDAAYHGFVYAGGVMTDLGTFGGSYSSVLDMNNHGQIVGDAADASEMPRAFLWENGTLTDLNTLLPPDAGWQLWSAQAINDQGQIVGYGLLNQAFAWFLLTLESNNNPPQAAAGPDQSMSCPGLVSLDGTGSSDPDGDSLEYVWTENDVVLGHGPTLQVHFAAGQHVVSLTVSDPSGQSSEDTLIVTIADTTPPTVSCPISRTLAVDQNCSAVVPDLLAAIVATDNCTEASALQKSQSPAAGSLVGLGTHAVTLTVTDASGNASTCVTELHVVDSLAPVVVTTPASVTVAADSDNHAALPDLAASVVASDNCTSADALSVAQSPAPGTRLSIGSHAVTLVVSDASGNQTSATTAFVVEDRSAPEIVCLETVAVQANQDGLAAVPNLLAQTVVSDNWTPVEQLSVSQSPAPGTEVGVGEYEVTLTVVDTAGNQASCSTLLVVEMPVCVPKVLKVTPSVAKLTKANRDMVPVTFDVTLAPGCETAVASEVVQVQSSDPVTGQGDNTSPDWEITGPLSVTLRAETSAKNDSRLYTIKVRSVDALGNVTLHEALVEVVKEKGGNKPDMSADSKGQKYNNGNGNKK